jgi:Domain of unknown function (DUF4281)/Sigma-70, region 4
MPTTIGVVYTFMIIGHWHEQTGGFGSLGQVRDLFQNPWLLPAGWVHYLAFDLLVGAWECADAEQRQIRHFLVIPFLLLTFLTGPIGFLLYPMPTNPIEALPEERRIAFLLAEVEGFACKEISSMLVIPIGTVMSRLGRCRVKLRHALSHRRRRGTRQTRA